MAPSTGPGDAAFEWNHESPTASRLAAAMLECGESVNSLSDKLFNGHRKSVQRYLKGQTISRPNRVRLAQHLGIGDPEELAPGDVLSDLRPLLEQVEELRKRRGLRVGRIVAEVRRLAER